MTKRAYMAQDFDNQGHILIRLAMRFVFYCAGAQEKGVNINQVFFFFLSVKS